MSDWLRKQVLRWLFPVGGCPPESINNRLRAYMAELKDGFDLRPLG